MCIKDNEQMGEILECSVCGKHIYGPKDEKLSPDIDNGIYEITTFHDDWGEDSWESYKKYTACGSECLQKIFNEYIKDTANNKSTQKIEIKHEYY